MHICFATLDYPTTSSGGGVATVTHLLAQALVANGHKVSVIRLGQDMPAYKDGLVQIHSLSQGSWHYYVSRLPLIGKHLGLPARELERSFRIAQKLKVLHDKDPIDIIEFSEEAVFFSAFSPLRNSCVYVARLHGTEYAWVPKVPGKKLSLALKMQRALQRYFLNRCPHLLAVSEYYKNDLRNDLGATTTARIKVMGNPVSPVPLPPSEMVALTAEPTFLFVGRIQDTKGIDLLLRALAKLKKGGYHFRLQVAGDHHPSIGATRYQKMLAEANLCAEVDTLGYQSKAQVAALMQGCTAVIVPSYFETFGLVGIEAIQAGVPLIHSRVGIMADLDRGDIPSVWLFPPGEQNALAAALQEVAENEPAKSTGNYLPKLKGPLVLNVHLDYFEELFLIKDMRPQT